MSGIMFQGTASNVGKSVIAAGVCRLLYQDGYNVVPFKPQNMSLNSYIDEDGLEMGRAQVFQAEACNKIPHAYMNPILLKPCGNHISQVIVNGKSVGNMSSKEYGNYKKKLIPVLENIFRKLENSHDAVIMEGAGSPAEININSLDLSNMKMAEIADVPVILVADIDRGGVFASVVGTLELLSEEDRKRVKGVIINKFRGNKEYFQDGVKMLEEIIKMPVLGVVPYSDFKIDEEDGVSSKFSKKNESFKDDCVNIEIIKLPHMSNYTDFEVFEHIEKVNVRYIGIGERIGYFDKEGNHYMPDMLIIPGSKNTVSDMEYLKRSGLYSEIEEYALQKRLLAGICGGYQIMGNTIDDRIGSDGVSGKSEGFGFFDMDTIFSENKITVQINGVFGKEEGYFEGLQGNEISGYELHLGRKNKEEKLNDKSGVNYEVKDGHLLGTYCHGFFDNIQFTSMLLNNIRKKKNLDELEINKKTFQEIKMEEYDKLGEIIRENLDIKLLYKIIFG